HAILLVAHLGVNRDLREIPAHEGKVMLFVQPSDRFDTVTGGLLANPASQGIGGVGGIGDHTALIQDIRSLLNQPDLRVYRMDLEKLAHRDCPACLEPPIQLGDAGTSPLSSAHSA